MEILTYKSGSFQPRIPKSTYSCSFWWIYFLVHPILPTKNPILTSLQCINQVIFRMIDFSIIDFESLLFSSVLFQIPIWMYLLDITDSIGLNAFKWHKMTEALSFSSCQRNLIKIFQIDGMIALILKMYLIFLWDLLNGQK